MAKKIRQYDKRYVKGYMLTVDGSRRGDILGEGYYDGHKIKVAWPDTQTYTYPDARGCAYVCDADDGLPIYQILA
mgnify:CR=1 FL=1